MYVTRIRLSLLLLAFERLIQVTHLFIHLFMQMTPTVFSRTLQLHCEVQLLSFSVCNVGVSRQNY